MGPHTAPLQAVSPASACTPAPSAAGPHLDGGFPSDVGDKEVHGDVLTVDVLIHHVSDGLGHHVRIQIGIILLGMEKQSHSVRGHTSLGFQQKCAGRLVGSGGREGVITGIEGVGARDAYILQGRSFTVNN